MRFLHTSDWHVGGVLKGASRHAEHAAVLSEIVSIAARERVDAVLIAGDLYESGAPGAAAQRLVVETLLSLRATGAEIVAIAGNHDHGPTFDAYRPLMAAAGIHLVGTPRRPRDGGVVAFDARSTGEPVRVAALPFVSQHHALRAADLVGAAPVTHTAGYAGHVRALVEALEGGFADGAVNLLTTHLTVAGAVLGGGERPAQSVTEYHVPAAILSTRADYVALGHMHRAQTLRTQSGPGRGTASGVGGPVRYCGSPLAVDFGEQDAEPSVTVVDVAPGGSARLRVVPLRSPRRLRTLRGSVAALRRLADGGAVDPDDALRVYVREPVRAGLREDVAAILPNAVEIRIDPAFAPAVPRRRLADAAPRAPLELFREYCAGVGVADDRLTALFARLHDEVTSTDRSGG
ncbi:MAG: exonuclease SbcCD subunit D [Frankia sp.]